MDLREAVERYANAVSSRDYYDDCGQAEKSRQCGLEAEQFRHCLDVLIDEAEAAIAYMEHQAVTVGAPHDGDVEYAQQRAEMWDAYMVARANAMSTTQQ